MRTQLRLVRRQQGKQRRLMKIGLVEGYTNLHDHSNGGQCSSHVLYATCVIIFLFALCMVSDIVYLSVPYITLHDFFQPLYIFERKQ